MARRPEAGTRVLRAMFMRARNRPEPFKPVDPYARRPRWGLLSFIGVVLISGAGLLAVLALEPRAPSPPPPAAPVAARTGNPAEPPAARPEPLRAVPALPPALPRAEPPAAAAPAPPPAREPERPRAPPPPAEPPAAAAREVVSTGVSGSNLRANPSMSGAVIWTAPQGTRLRVIGEAGVWANVETADGARSGWMHRSLLADP